MIKIRKDSKGRELYTNKSQIKNGSYVYRYTDTDGNRKSVTSWRLIPQDIGPEKYKDQECLRDMEARIRRSITRGADPILDRNLTVNDFWDRYLSLKCEIAESTLVSYIYLYNRHLRNGFGKRRIAAVRYSDIKKFYIDKMKEGLSVSSIANLHNIVSPIFQLALRDGYIDANPAMGVLSEFQRRRDWSQTHRDALTRAQQNALVEFTGSNYRYKGFMPILTVFLGCGLRAGELAGLTWQDVDFENNLISVNHTLNYDIALDGKCQYYITYPKTHAGIREIPMLDDVRDTLLKLFERRNDFNMDNQVMIDGYTNFVFRDLYGNVYNDSKLNRVLKNIRNSYNKQEEEKAEAEGREPNLLPHFTCHHLRHTFCTRICESGELSIKTIQYIMGHSHPETTLRIYAQVSDSRNQEEMAALNGKMKIK